MVSIGIVGRTGRYVNDGAASPPTNLAATKWRSNMSAATSTGIWRSKLTNWVGVRKPQLDSKRTRAVCQATNVLGVLHELKFEAFRLVARRRGPGSGLPMSSVRWPQFDNLERALEKLALKPLTYERDACPLRGDDALSVRGSITTS